MTVRPGWWTVQWAEASDGYKYNGKIAGPRGLVLHSTAMPGAGADAIFKNFNRPNRGASIHGALDDRKFIQMMPFTQKAGHVGSGKNGSFNATHLGIELCEPTGLVYNTKTWAVERYEPPAGYFDAIWDKATTLYASLCREFGIDPLRHDAGGGIVAHYEAHALGYGDNHGDPRAWFACEGRTMDDFRRAVAEKLSETEDDSMTYDDFKAFMEKYLNEAQSGEPSPWAEDACKKAIEKGIVQGDGKGAYNFQRPLTREAYLVLQDRAGLL